MKSMLKYIAAAALVIGCAAACDKDNDDNDNGNIPEKEIVQIGTYEFDGKECGIADGFYTEDGYAYYFFFSPQAADTAIAIGLAKTFVGTEMDVTRFYTGDFIFYYEDPIYLYPETCKFRSGTVCIQKLPDGFEIKIDAVLPDGKPFKLDFSGSLKARGGN